MTIRISQPLKTCAQSALPVISSGLVRQSTDTPLSALTAFLLGIRGLGWSPIVEIEARSAARWVDHDEFVVIDAGANIGEWAAFFTRAKRGKGKIFAFEPQSAAAAQVRARRIPGCEVCEVALSSRNGTARFYTSGATDTMGSLHEHGDTLSCKLGKQYVAIEVPTIRLDDFVTERGLQRVDFMKMDLEGAELEALAGAKHCIESGLVRALSFEFGVSNVNSRTFFKDYFSLFSDCHYELYRMTPAGGLIRIAEYSEDYEIFARTSTYFARRPRDLE